MMPIEFNLQIDAISSSAHTMPFKHLSSDTQGLLTYCLCLPLSFPDNAPTCVFIEPAQSASPHAEPLLSPSVPHTDTDSLFSPPYGTRNQNLPSFPVSCRSVSQTNQLVCAVFMIFKMFSFVNFRLAKNNEYSLSLRLINVSQRTVRL